MKIVAIPIYEHKNLILPDVRKILTDAGFEMITNDIEKVISRKLLKDLVSSAYAVIAGVEVYDRDIFESAKELKIIARYGVGLDNIDTEEAHRRGIKIAKTENHDTIAEFTISIILNTMKNISWFDKTTKEGQWTRKISDELNGKTVGLIGFGKIAQTLVKRLSGFDVKFYAYDPIKNSELAKALCVEYKQMDFVIKNSDIISLHLPYLPETYHLFGEKQFAMMRDGSYFINTARGPIVDEKALYNALKSGKLAGAGIDVFEIEPSNKDNPLFTLENIICTPHIASTTHENIIRNGIMCAEAIVAVSEGREIHPY